MGERLTDAHLRYAERPAASAEVVVLAAEVRRLRGIIADACDGCVSVDGRLGELHSTGLCNHGCGDPECNCVDDSNCDVAALEAEARAIQEEESRG